MTEETRENQPAEIDEGRLSPRRASRFRFRRRWYVAGCLAVVAGIGAVLTAGRHPNESVSAPQAIAVTPAVQVVAPTVRDLSYTVGQPGFVKAYEQTAIYSKVSGFIKKFNVDIGDEVKAGQVLAEIFVPELEEDYQQKVAEVELDENGVEQAKQLVKVAQSQIQSAIAEANQAKANIGKYSADVVRWDSELRRITQVAAEKAIDLQVLDETKKQFDASKSERDAAIASAAAKDAARLTAEADLAKAKIDVEVAKSKVKVAKAEERRAAALLAYTKITAPYDGVVTVRNANTGDYVQAASGDRSVSNGSAIFVVDRTDVLRIFVDIPEAYARYVQKGTKAAVRVEALNGVEIPAAVTRTSWSLQTTTRTLLAEIDLAGKDRDGLRPGMYVYGKVFVDRARVRVVPQHCLVVQGNQTYCYLVRDGKVVKASVECGMSDGTWVELLQKKIGDTWRPIKGDEQVVQGDLSDLADGQPVRVAADSHEARAVPVSTPAPTQASE